MQQPDHTEVYRFVEQKSEPFVTSTDVAEQFESVSDKTIRKRLNDLVEDNRLESRVIGAAAKVWYTP